MGSEPIAQQMAEGHPAWSFMLKNAGEYTCIFGEKCYTCIMKGGDNMVAAEAVKSRQTSYTIDDAMDILLDKLDEAIDDMENGRVQSVDEAWDEIDQI